MILGLIDIGPVSPWGPCGPWGPTGPCIPCSPLVPPCNSMSIWSPDSFTFDAKSISITLAISIALA